MPGIANEMQEFWKSQGIGQSSVYLLRLRLNLLQLHQKQSLHRLLKEILPLK